MNEMKKQIVTVGNSNVAVKEFKGQRVVTFKDIDTVHERPEGTAKRNFSENRKRFTEGEDFFILKPGDVEKYDFRTLEIPNRGLTVMTEPGYLMLAKPFTDDLSWKVQRQLVSSYFKKEGIPQKENSHPERLSSVNMMVKNVKEALKEAGVDSKYIAAEVVRIYSDSGHQVKVPLISDVPALWDCTSIAKELGIMSEYGRPHDKAVSAIIQKLDIFSEEVVRTAYSRNGHGGVTVQYKGSVLEKVREWLDENCYPTIIEVSLSNGKVNKCKVVYREEA